MMVKTILVPVDFSKCSTGVVHHAGELAKPLGARVVLLHVSELPPLGSEVMTQGHRLLADATARLQEMAERVRVHGVVAEVEARLGPIAPTIVAAARECSADLLVMGTHSRRGLARLVLGSVAEAVSHESAVPVLLIRREARPECGRESCEWCPHEGRSPLEMQVAAESEG